MDAKEQRRKAMCGNQLGITAESQQSRLAYHHTRWIVQSVDVHDSWPEDLPLANRLPAPTPPPASARRHVHPSQLGRKGEAWEDRQSREGTHREHGTPQQWHQSAHVMSRRGAGRC